MSKEYSKTPFSRFMSVVLSIALIISVMPVTVSADEITTDTDTANVITSDTVTAVDESTQTDYGDAFTTPQSLDVEVLSSTPTPAPSEAADGGINNNVPLVNAQAPGIISQPKGATVNAGAAGSTYELSVEAESPDGGTLTYQWFSNGTAANTGGFALTAANNAQFYGEKV